jgi:hypothetical protein
VVNYVSISTTVPSLETLADSSHKINMKPIKQVSIPHHAGPSALITLFFFRSSGAFRVAQGVMEEIEVPAYFYVSGLSLRASVEKCGTGMAAPSTNPPQPSVTHNKK